jgi:hypothetical protein
MRYKTLNTVALALTAATAFGQQPFGRNTAIPQRQESDSTFIAREWAAWNAVKAADSAAFVRAVGSSPYLFFVYSNGVTRTSAAKFAGAATKCDTRSNKLDMFNVVHPNDDTAISIYRVTLDRRCGTTVDRGVRQMMMTVWVRRNGRWEAVAQSITPMTASNDAR